MQSPVAGSGHTADADARLAMQCPQSHQHAWHQQSFQDDSTHLNCDRYRENLRGCSHSVETDSLLNTNLISDNFFNDSFHTVRDRIKY